MAHQIPTFDFEQQYWQQGILHVAGIDEVGMGALAGPVVAGAVVFDGSVASNITDLISEVAIRDSKTLSAKQREKAVLWIQEHALAFAIGEASVAEIFSLNIRLASHLAMQRAVQALAQTPDIYLIDGNPVQINATVPAINVIKGDSLCYSIAAASILAKVHRDNLMHQLHEQYPAYNFAGNKGYGSASHLMALKELGATQHHRAGYAPVATALQSRARNN